MKEKQATVGVETRIAQFSDCEKYRYSLSISWNSDLPRIQFIGLNPSTADEMKDDPTIRRVKGFARDWGFGSVVMTNLFAWRDTDPAAMKKQPNPVGEPGTFFTPCGTEFSNRNDFYLYVSRLQSAKAIAAWGLDGGHLYRAAKVKQFLTGLECIRLTKAGHPEHPLYLPAILKPIPLP